MALGFKIRTGGGLPEKLFGAFSSSMDYEEADADSESEISADEAAASHWVKKQNVESKLNGYSFTFALRYAASPADAIDLYKEFVCQQDFRLYK